MEIELFTRVAALSALSVVAVQEILKLKIVPVSFANRYPVPTNIILSIIAAVIVSWQDLLNVVVWTDYIVLAGVTAVVAAITYNSLLKNWSQLKSMEGEK